MRGRGGASLGCAQHRGGRGRVDRCAEIKYERTVAWRVEQREANWKTRQTYIYYNWKAYFSIFFPPLTPCRYHEGARRHGQLPTANGICNRKYLKKAHKSSPAVKLRTEQWIEHLIPTWVFFFWSLTKQLTGRVNGDTRSSLLFTLHTIQSPTPITRTCFLNTSLHRDYIVGRSSQILQSIIIEGKKAVTYF